MLFRLAPSFRALRRHAVGLVIAMGLSVCAPVLLSALQTQIALAEVVVDLTDLSDEKEDAIPPFAIVRIDVAPARQERAMANAAPLPGCRRDAPPTPPPDRGA